MGKQKDQLLSEESKNGAISDEALGEIAGGFKINKNSLKKVLNKVGIAVFISGGLSTGLSALSEDKTKKPKKNSDDSFSSGA